MRKINIYQIDPRKDKNIVRFLSYKRTIQYGKAFDPNIYREVFRGEFIDGVTLEDLFFYFNVKTMAGFYGHSLSISDVIQVTEAGTTKSYFVEDIGFKEIAFDNSGIEQITGIRCVATPDAETHPFVTTLKDDYRVLQKAVDGNFDFECMPEYGVLLMCNDESKINGMKFNRDLGFDIVYGPLAIVRRGEHEDIVSLTDEQVNTYIDALSLLTIGDEDEFIDEDEEDDEEEE